LGPEPEIVVICDKNKNNS